MYHRGQSVSIKTSTKIITDHQLPKTREFQQKRRRAINECLGEITVISTINHRVQDFGYDHRIKSVNATCRTCFRFAIILYCLNDTWSVNSRNTATINTQINDPLITKKDREKFASSCVVTINISNSPPVPRNCLLPVELGTRSSGRTFVL